MKTYFKNKRAFTLIELLIVIAIIGILFIVLVSKVDFATDKAKASGVQTDFRSFQTAFEQVARENSGYATLGWDTGDDNGDRVRNSYDKGDKECGQSGCTECKQDGVKGPHEVFVGSKTYGEEWSGTYTLVNPDDSKDASAFVALENAINANLDPKLHITLTPNADASGNLTGSAAITMANQARDPWKNEYAGAYISNATVDKLDRGSIVMYSTGANGQLGTNYSVSGGLVGVEVPGSNINGKDDYVLSVTYSYANGYGEVQTGTAGFSNNQSTLTSTPIVDNGVNAGGMSAGVGSVPGGNNGNGNNGTENVEYTMLVGDMVSVSKSDPVQFRSEADLDKFVKLLVDGTEVNSQAYILSEGSTNVVILGRYVNTLSNGAHSIEIVSIDGSAKGTLTVNIDCREHADEFLEETDWCPDSICDHCGIVWCSHWDCRSLNDDCFCDWCGHQDSTLHDYDYKGYCTRCNYFNCSYMGECIDADHDGKCDSCLLLLLDGYGPCDKSIDDQNNDGYCDVCNYHFDHYDTDDGYCDVCNHIYCSDKDIHHAKGEWAPNNNWCYWCWECVVHVDEDYDGECDNCWNEVPIVCPGHNDFDYNGVCDICSAIPCNETGICRDLDRDNMCDGCNTPYECTHYDENDFDNYCDWCDEAIPCFICYHIHSGEPYCEECVNGASHECFDMNADDYCDCCKLCYYCYHKHYGTSCPQCMEQGYCEYGDRDDNCDGICDCCGSSC